LFSKGTASEAERCQNKPCQGARVPHISQRCGIPTNHKHRMPSPRIKSKVLAFRLTRIKRRRKRSHCFVRERLQNLPRAKPKGAETDRAKGPYLTAVGRSGTEGAATRIKNSCARKTALKPPICVTNLHLSPSKCHKNANAFLADRTTS
jgi:hypothetical protein